MARGRVVLGLACLLVAWAVWADWRESRACEARGGTVVRASGVPLRCEGGR